MTLVLRSALVAVLTLAAAGSAALASARPAGAATISGLSTFEDDFTDNNDCSLREAIQIANQNSAAAEDECTVDGQFGNDTVELQAGTYVLSLSGSGENDNATGDLDITTGVGASLTIDGAGAALTTIDTDNTPAWDDRVLHRQGIGTLTVSDLTVTGGDAPGDGGGILSGAGELALDGVRVAANHSDVDGGGLEASGVALSIVDSAITDNSSGGLLGGGVNTRVATAIDGSAIEDNQLTADSVQGGGGVATIADLTISDSRVAGNTVTDTDGIGFSRAGGIRFVAGPGGTVRGTTISGNRVLGGASRLGGGIEVANGAAVDLVNATVSGNDVTPGGGGGLTNQGGTVRVIHSTFGPNAVGGGGGAALQGGGTIEVRGSVIETSGGAAACVFATGVTSLGHNIGADTTCDLTATGDQQGVDAKLGPLQDNGGPDAGAPGFPAPILTHAPSGDSTAVDHVPAADCTDEPGPEALAVDQRGEPRPFDGDGDSVADCDAGSVELQSVFVPPPPADTPAAKCAGLTATISGTPDPEAIRGTAGRDVIAGLGGNDVIRGLGGNDVVCGGAGVDRLLGGPGQDRLLGGPGNDRLAGGAGNDRLVGGPGADRLLGGPGRDTLLGQPGADILLGHGGNDLLRGGPGRDVLRGGPGRDRLRGGAGRDRERQ
jgi:CSLREA domain-containing protein